MTATAEGHQPEPARLGARSDGQEPVAAHDEQVEDVTDDHLRTWAAFLDQGRWLLQEQQRRGASFQATAGTLLGFDGILLGILATNDFLATDDIWSVRSIVGKLGVLALAWSSIAAVQVIAPRPTGSVVIADTLEAWRGFHAGKEVRATQLFAQMLLAEHDPNKRQGPAGGVVDQSDDLPGVDAARESGASTGGAGDRSVNDRQVIEAAASLAEHRSKWTRRSAFGLLGAVFALTLAVLAAPSSHQGPPPSPSQTANY